MSTERAGGGRRATGPDPGPGGASSDVPGDAAAGAPGAGGSSARLKASGRVTLNLPSTPLRLPDRTGAGGADASPASAEPAPSTAAHSAAAGPSPVDRASRRRRHATPFSLTEEDLAPRADLAGAPAPPRAVEDRSDRGATHARGGPGPGAADATLPPASALDPLVPQRPSQLPPPADAWARDRHARRVPTPSPLPAPARPTRQIRAQRAPTPPPMPALRPEGGALDLVDRKKPSSPTLDIGAEMHERFALGDFSGALQLAELTLGAQPDREDAKEVAERARERLIHLYSSRFGSLARVPVVAVRDGDLRWLGLDHRAVFLLSRVDGRATLEELLEVGGMPRVEALKTFVELFDVGAIRFVDG